MKIQTYLFLSFLFSLPTIRSWSQVVADFQMDDSIACSSLVVHFTDASQPTDGSLSYSWDFGNGNTSSLRNPDAAYNSPGTYTVTLTVSKGGSSDTRKGKVIVYKEPQAGFNANGKGCIPYTVTFTDKSTIGDAPISSWRWYFHTGDIADQQNTQFTYNTAGKFDVSLRVIDENGCASTLLKENVIDVADPPVAEYAAVPASSCTVPVDVTFQNSSTGPGIVTYTWDFGDGSQSAEKNPVHTYDAFGSYDVSLNVSSDYGCQASIQSTYTVSEVTVGGKLEQAGNLIEEGAVICAGNVTFTNESTGTPYCLWNFGDGTSVSDNTGVHAYEVPGDYTVMLIASPGYDCADTIKWNFTVEKPSASFTMDPASSCESPVTVNFNNTSQDASSFEWEFQDGATSTLENTTHDYSVSTNADKYAIDAEYYFVTKLTVTSDNGCKSTVSKSLRIKKPTALFMPDTVQGCVPLEVGFTDKSRSDGQITKWTYLFGDGSFADATNSPVTHVYNSEGVYQARLRIENQKGCVDTSYAITIRAGKKPHPDFAVSPASACASTAVQFTDMTPATDNADSWHYASDGGIFSSCDGNPDPSFFLHSDTGYIDVTLTVGSNGCYADTTITGAIFSEGPVMDFDYSLDCNTPLTYHFESTMKGADSFKWVFGDGDENSADKQPVHTYGSEGNYTVNLIGFHNGCSDTATQIVRVRALHAKISGDSTGCADSPATFYSSGSVYQNDFCTEQYLWDFGDGSRRIRSANDSIQHSFSQGGLYYVSLEVNYDNGCKDITSKEVHVYQPHAGFMADTTLGCAPFPVTFTDTSKADVHPLKKWEWDFGDGQNQENDTKPAAFSHLFSATGIFNVSLVVTDTMGCQATGKTTVYTANPSADFSIAPEFSDNVCAGEETAFQPSYIGGDSAVWNFGDGILKQDLSLPAKHTYYQAGQYEVSLIMFKYGCSDTVTKPNDFISVQQADARFVTSDTIWNCYPKEITFTHPENPEVDSRKWYFGYGGGQSDEGTVRVFNYQKPGDYDVSLLVETSFGCRDTFVQHIAIRGPSGSYTVTPRQACLGDEVTFSLQDTSNVYDFEWDLGDGNIVKGNPVTHTYTSGDTIIPSLILYGDKGSCTPPPVQDTIYIHEVTAAFSTPEKAFCAGQPVSFSNESAGFTSLNWDFGDGNNSSEIAPSHVFSAGVYQVTLAVWNEEAGCRDTIDLPLEIHAPPALTLGNDTLICEGGQLVLRALGGHTINWTPAELLDDASVYQPVAAPDQSTLFSATVKDTITGCQTSGDINVEVQPLPAVLVYPYPDTTVIIGEDVPLYASSSDSEVTYHWEPSDGLSCTECADPVAHTLGSITYTLLVKDKNGCFNIEKDVKVIVDEAYALNMPSAFTPNGDGKNDVVYVRGWGIKELLEFKIFNRWGNMVFSTTDLSTGWDGTHNGKDQNIDTYVYVVTVLNYDGKVVTKKGTINLMR